MYEEIANHYRYLAEHEKRMEHWLAAAIRFALQKIPRLKMAPLATQSL